MRSYALAALAAVFVFVAPLAVAQEQAAPATPQAWRAAAESDLEALRMYLREDTPIALDDENPRMQAWLEQGYREARARVRRVNDRESYFYALAPYTNGFRDPHVRLFPTAQLDVARWPGFIATSSGDGAVVLHRDETDDAAPAVGARIVSCDGRSLEQLRQRKLYPFTLNPHQAADRRSSSARLFLDRGNPFAPPPRRCVFEQDGERRTIVLNWRDVPGDAYWTQFSAASLGPAASFGVSTPADGVTWIGLPTFATEAGDQVRAIVDEISANAETIRNGRAIVIDVRGNGGGNSEWGAEIARAIWGERIIDALDEPSPGGAVDWRVSQRNIDYIDSFAPQLIAQFGEDSDMGRWLRTTQQGFAETVARGEQIWRQREDDETGPIPTGGGYTQRRPQGASPFPAQVYILSNGTCVSACLDFADIALHVPGARLIGSDTSGDGLLMEVREQVLPSGQSRVILPLKVYRGRARGALEAYAADVAYDGVWTDEAIRAWTMELIARQ